MIRAVAAIPYLWCIEHDHAARATAATALLAAGSLWIGAAATARREHVAIEATWITVPAP
jgi:hypothetical protein